MGAIIKNSRIKYAKSEKNYEFELSALVVSRGFDIPHNDCLKVHIVLPGYPEVRYFH